jgi:hypothetical protein
MATLTTFRLFESQCVHRFDCPLLAACGSRRCAENQCVCFPLGWSQGSSTAAPRSMAQLRTVRRARAADIAPYPSWPGAGARQRPECSFLSNSPEGDSAHEWQDCHRARGHVTAARPGVHPANGAACEAKHIIGATSGECGARIARLTNRDARALRASGACVAQRTANHVSTINRDLAGKCLLVVSLGSDGRNPIPDGGGHNPNRARFG